jgi:NAD(P)-dependent dehydrogenase (short-subunit alcohol dehydrogenase family)
MASRRTVVVTGASQGIGAGVARAFLQRNYNVVANSRNISRSGNLRESESLALVDGNIGESSVAARIAETAIARFGSLDAVVNNAGLFFAKPFTEFTAEDFDKLATVNLKGFLYLTQLSVKQMLRQNRDGSVVTITSSQAVNPIAGVLGSLPMITKGGLEAVTKSLAIEYAKERIRFNAVGLGIVDTPMHVNESKEFLQTLSPMNTISSVADVVDAIIYLTEAGNVTGEILHVDGGAHQGRW